MEPRRAPPSTRMEKRRVMVGWSGLGGGIHLHGPQGGRHMSTHVKELVYFFGRLPVKKNIPLDLRGFGDENNPKSKIETPLDGLRRKRHGKYWE